jgi:hypothetical protein
MTSYTSFVPTYTEMNKQDGDRLGALESANSLAGFVPIGAIIHYYQKNQAVTNNTCTVANNGDGTWTITDAAASFTTTVRIGQGFYNSTGEGQIKSITSNTVMIVRLIRGSFANAAYNVYATPPYPPTFALCDGSTLNDTDSVYHNRALPNLITNNVFMRANSTSGGTGGATTHTHTVDVPATAVAVAGNVVHGSGATPITTSTSSNVPPYIDMVPIIRIK